MVKPLVSVLTISFKHEEFIQDTIEGVLNQEVSFPIEFIIADDCSPDNTKKVVQHYIDNHPRGYLIKYTRHSINKGMNKNFIWALNKCVGKYVAICEGDDYWIDPFKLQKQVEFLESNEDFSACYHRCSVINDKNELVRENKWSNYKNHSSNDLLYGEAHLITNTVVFRNVVSFPKKSLKVKNLDTFLWHLLGFHGAAKFIDSIQPSAYRLHQGGVWSLKDKYYQLQGSLNTYSLLASNLKAEGMGVDKVYSIASGVLDKYMIAQLGKRNFKNYLRGIKVFLNYKSFSKRQFLKLHFRNLFLMVKKNKKRLCIF